MSKKIAVYGTFKAKAPITYKQRYWKRRPDGAKQRYWKRVIRSQKVVKSGRYEFHGKGRDLYQARAIAEHVMPKGFVSVSAEKFAVSRTLWFQRRMD